MPRLLVTVLIFGGGVAVGLLVAKLYVKSKITDEADSLLGKFGLGGGAIQNVVDNTIVPFVVS